MVPAGPSGPGGRIVERRVAMDPAGRVRERPTDGAPEPRGPRRVMGPGSLELLK